MLGSRLASEPQGEHRRLFLSARAEWLLLYFGFVFVVAIGFVLLFIFAFVCLLFVWVLYLGRRGVKGRREPVCIT